MLTTLSTSRQCCGTVCCSAGAAPRPTPSEASDFDVAPARTGRRALCHFAALQGLGQLLWPGVAASTCSEAIDGTSTTCSPLLNTELREVTTSQYSLSVPADYLGFDGIEATATGTLGVAVSTPPLLRYGSADGKENLSVVVRDAASIKPTFFQITDITQYGGLADVAKLVLPKNSRFLSAESITLPQPPYDTGTIRGVIELPDIHLYRYEFQTVEDQHYALSIAASRGQVYFVGASAPVDRWNDEKETLLNSVQSFRLKRY